MRTYSLSRRNSIFPRRKKGIKGLFLSTLAFWGVVLGSELYFQWIEVLVGNYVNQHRDELPQEGAFWQQVERAKEALELRSAERLAWERNRRQAEEATHFAELLTFIPSQGVLPISPAKFVALYLALPESIQTKIISSHDLAKLYHQSDWSRCLLSRQQGRAVALMVDGHNQPLHPLILLPEAEIGASHITGRQVNLDQDPSYQGRIYDGEIFLRYLMILTDAEREAMFPDPLFLLQIPRPLGRVGLAPPNQEGWAKIALEGKGDNKGVVELPISAYTFNRLAFALSWEDGDTLWREGEGAEEMWGGGKEEGSVDIKKGAP